MPHNALDGSLLALFFRLNNLNAIVPIPGIHQDCDRLRLLIGWTLEFLVKIVVGRFTKAQTTLVCPLIASMALPGALHRCRSLSDTYADGHRIYSNSLSPISGTTKPQHSTFATLGPSLDLLFDLLPYRTPNHQTSVTPSTWLNTCSTALCRTSLTTGNARHAARSSRPTSTTWNLCPGTRLTARTT
jgi:hypothetical protein